eukprot:TRINITY_DN14695_c0_g1_i19.p1 TRINITY_DN14695_c0_g1~~TRINITY_DN14695_c0_g1_i19.p1  ORF type:complete len:473 (+),score=72.06 TRINITY_DN14695_c0_g1_i19:368-1786(+)
MVKAVLMLCSSPLTGKVESGRFTARKTEIPLDCWDCHVQGWGRPQLSRCLPLPSSNFVVNLQVAPPPPGPVTEIQPANLLTLATGERHQICAKILNPAPGFHVALAWTDPEADLGASKTLVNDLDLTVLGGGGGMRYGNERLQQGKEGRLEHVPDRRNPWEQVRIGPGELIAGDVFRIQVTAHQVTADAVQDGSNTNKQDFALVLSGGFVLITENCATMCIEGETSPCEVTGGSGVKPCNTRTGAFDTPCTQLLCLRGYLPDGDSCVPGSVLTSSPTPAPAPECDLWLDWWCDVRDNGMTILIVLGSVIGVGLVAYLVVWILRKMFDQTMESSQASLAIRMGLRGQIQRAVQWTCHDDQLMRTHFEFLLFEQIGRAFRCWAFDNPDISVNEFRDNRFKLWGFLLWKDLWKPDMFDLSEVNFNFMKSLEERMLKLEGDMLTSVGVFEAMGVEGVIQTPRDKTPPTGELVVGRF